MTTVLRVKRRNNDEPQSVLILCKRLKLDDNAVVPTVVKFAGTIKNSKEENVVEHLAKTLNKEELKINFKQPPTNVLEKIHAQVKANSAENRYKIVNCLRSLNTSDAEKLDNKSMTVIDVEDSVSLAAEQNVETEEDCAYDLYYTDTDYDAYVNLFVQALSDEYNESFVMYRESDTESHDSEDSNCESNWRNDYPDTDYSDKSNDEEDLKGALRHLADYGLTDEGDNDDDDNDNGDNASNDNGDNDNDDDDDDDDDDLEIYNSHSIDFGSYKKYNQYVQRMRELKCDDSSETSSEVVSFLSDNEDLSPNALDNSENT